MSKEIIRGNILKNRRLLSEIEVSGKSSAIVSVIRNSNLFNSSKHIALYHPFRNEVDLLPLLEEKNRLFYFPKVEGTSRKLSFYNVTGLHDFVKGAYGIMEPADELPAIDISSIDLFMVPGVAFSEKGERIGYGGGYYDATLQQRRANSFALGVAFDMQIVPSGFADSHDKYVDGIITESQTLLIKTKE